MQTQTSGNQPIVVALCNSLRREIGCVVAASQPHEACGLLLGRRYRGSAAVDAVVAVDNCTRHDPRSYYQIDPVDFLHVENEARMRDQEVIGVWHSHPHGPILPSASDRELAWPDWCYLIAGYAGDGELRFGAWRFVADEMIEDQLSQ